MQPKFNNISNGVNPRILIFTVAYEPLIGGAELAVRNITDRLPSYDFDLITARLRPDLPAEERIGNVNVYRVGFGGRLGRYLYPVFAFRKARILQQRQPYRIVWAIMAAYGAAAALMFLRRFPKVKFLLTLQEGDPIEHIHRRVRGFKRFWRQAFRRADRIQAISGFLAEWARAEGAKCPIDIVPNGVDLEKFKIQKSKCKMTMQNAKFTIITASRLVPKNGVDVLIRAAAELKSTIHYSPFTIQILGGGPEENKLKKLAADLAVADSVKFLGGIAPEQVPAYLAAADIFVRPSRSEGLGSAFLEAMAVGLPVIGTAVGGIPDFLRDGETGLVCETNNSTAVAGKIMEYVNNPERRKKIAENGQKLVQKNYDWSIIAGKIENILRELNR